MNRFRINIIVKIFLIVSSFIAGYWFLYESNLILIAVFLFLVSVYFTSSLFKYIDKINRDLKRFLTSIKYSDFTQNFLFKNFGSSYGDLYKSISSSYSDILTYRIQAEENLQYLNTLIELVPSGIISYKESGKVELINEAAKQLLNTKNLNNIHLEKNNVFKDLLGKIEIGKEKTIKLIVDSKEKNISVFASKFKLRNQLYTLIAIKDLENELEKERLENELNIAQNVQSSLLPQKIPVYQNYEISILFKPAKRVGGDFFDFFEFDNNKVGLIIGDVSGKGLGAAIYTTLIKGIFQTLASECISTSEVLTKANSLIYNMLDKKSFITAIYAVLDTEQNILRFSRAGHEPLLIYKTDKNDFQTCMQSGLGLGLEKGMIFSRSLSEQSITLDIRDTILLYTDGLVDLKNFTGTNDSLEDFKEIVKTSNSEGADFIIANFEKEINHYTDKQEQYDDITTIVIRRKF